MTINPQKAKDLHFQMVMGEDQFPHSLVCVSFGRVSFDCAKPKWTARPTVFLYRPGVFLSEIGEGHRTRRDMRRIVKSLEMQRKEEKHIVNN